MHKPDNGKRQQKKSFKDAVMCNLWTQVDHAGEVMQHRIKLFTWTTISVRRLLASLPIALLYTLFRQNFKHPQNS